MHSREKKVVITVNGDENQDVAMVLGEAGEAFFVIMQDLQDDFSDSSLLTVSRSLEATS